MNIRLVKSIELLKLDMESVLVNLESTQMRIGLRFSVICGSFLLVLGFCRSRRARAQMISGIDRARQFRAKASAGSLGIDTYANRSEFFCSSWCFLVVFYGLGEQEGAR